VLNYIKADFIRGYLLDSLPFDLNWASSVSSTLVSLFIRASSSK